MTPKRLILGAFGDAGHAFPIIALGQALASRGHEVTVQTWARWSEHIEAAGMRFAAAPEYHVFPTRERPLAPYEAVFHAARETRSLVRDVRPDAVLADILTLAPALAGELEGVPWATVIPHVYPVGASGLPPYSLGARLPRTPAGRRLWSRFEPAVGRGLARGRDELNGTRARLGLPPVDRFHNGLSQRLTLVATFPQLEYPRAWPEGTKVVGPLMWEMPFGDVELPPGDDPLVLVAPSTVHDPSHRLLRAAVEGLAGERVRVLASTNRRPLPRPLAAPANTRIVEWVSYARTMPRCAVVICNAGHGTMVRALASGARVVAAPGPGDQNENSARLDWFGAGVRVPWRWVGPRSIRLAVRRALADEGMAERAAQLAEWARSHPGPERAADEVESAFASGRL
jgi:UDP:flavonoid glycosyltransferase YjiC (YdhE family)